MPKRRIHIELPPVEEVWKESCVLYSSSYPNQRRADLQRLVKDVRTALTLDQVHPGLLNKFVGTPCQRCGSPNRSTYRRQNTFYPKERDNWIFACDACWPEIEAFWRDRWDEYHSECL